jgi:hypothetical protein
VAARQIVRLTSSFSVTNLGDSPVQISPGRYEVLSQGDDVLLEQLGTAAGTMLVVSRDIYRGLLDRHRLIVEPAGWSGRVS